MPNLKTVAPARQKTTTRVVISCPSRGTMPTHTARSLVAMAVWDAKYGSGYLQHRTPANWVIGSSLVGNARNKLVELFLNLPDEPEWLLFVDDDQVYPDTLIEAMMLAVKTVEAETGVKCMTMSVPVWRFMGEEAPKVTHNVFNINDSGHFEPIEDDAVPENTVTQIAGIGAGCVMVHREALLRIRDVSVEQGFGDMNCWFRHIVWPNNEGEDLYFCRMLLGSKIPLWMTTAVGVLEHIKTVRLDKALPSGSVTI
jgi:hypothetical protein